MTAYSKRNKRTINYDFSSQFFCAAHHALNDIFRVDLVKPVAVTNGIEFTAISEWSLPVTHFLRCSFVQGLSVQQKAVHIKNDRAHTSRSHVSL
jgi:hypothetical protein